MALDYCSVVADYITEHNSASSRSAIGCSATTQLICDYEHGHFLLLSAGWQAQEKRIYQVIMHIDVVDGKVLIQNNMTDRDIEAELIQLGVRPEDIILELVPPVYRQLAGRL